MDVIDKVLYQGLLIGNLSLIIIPCEVYRKTSHSSHAIATASFFMQKSGGA